MSPGYWKILAVIFFRHGTINYQLNLTVIKAERVNIMKSFRSLVCKEAENVAFFLLQWCWKNAPRFHYNKAVCNASCDARMWSILLSLACFWLVEKGKIHFSFFFVRVCINFRGLMFFAGHFFGLWCYNFDEHLRTVLNGNSQACKSWFRVVWNKVCPSCF